MIKALGHACYKGRSGIHAKPLAALPGHGDVLYAQPMACRSNVFTKELTTALPPAPQTC